MNLFEGLEEPRSNYKSTSAAVSAWASAQQLLVTAGPEAPACLVGLSAPGQPHQPQPDCYQLHADVQKVSSEPGLLLCCACDGLGPADVQCCPVTSQHGTGDLLALFRHGCSLKLFAVGPPVANAGIGRAGQLQLLADFEHEGFESLTERDCHLLPGRVLLLQPIPSQLLVLQPAADKAAEEANREPEVRAPAWEVTEVQLPAEALLQAAAADFPDVLARVRGRVGISRGGSIATAGPWQLLHSGCVPGQPRRIQVLLAQPVAAVRAPQQHEQQQAVLLFLVDIIRSSAPSTVAQHVLQQGAAASWCHALDWPAAPKCAAVLPPACCTQTAGSAHSWQQLVAVGSGDGGLHVINLSSSGGPLSCQGSSTGQHQRRGYIGTQLATAQLPGALWSLVHLPRVYLAGAAHTHVLAVLHDAQVGSGADSTPRKGSSSMAVTLLQLQEGGQLQQLAVVQGALGLCAPAHSPLGIVCPQQPMQEREQQQHQGYVAYADATALQLAAVIPLDLSAAKQQDIQDSLGQYAWLPHGGVSEALPGPLLGVLAAPPSVSQQLQAGTAGHLGDSPAAVQDAAAGAAVQDSNELKGLKSMLAALHSRWQHGTRELCLLQQRVVTAQRMAAAGHRQLCQMAADTLTSSSVRQYCVPSAAESPNHALAVYHAGRQLAEQQTQQQDAAQQQAAVSALPWPPSNNAAPHMQLLLQVVSTSSRCDSQHLQLQVCVQPTLRCMSPQQPSESRRMEWSGALLQPCHAELLLWHACSAGVTATSTWSWDAVSGHLVLTASVALGLLLQLHSICSSSSSPVMPSGSSAEQAAGSGACAGGGTCAMEGQAQVAQALAAAARRAAAGMHGEDSITCNRGASGPSVQAVQLHAAIAVSASCSNQAVVQWECWQEQGHGQQEHAQDACGVLRRSQLLSPAMALLHLQPFPVPVQDLLLQQLSCHTQAPRDLPLQTAQEAAVPHAATTPQHTPVKAAAAGSKQVQHCGGLTGPDVVPPTPCSADGSAGDLGVIPDSQEDENEQEQGPQERRQQLQQWWQTQQQRQQPPSASSPGSSGGDSPAGRDGAGGMDWEAGGNGSAGHARGQYAAALAAGRCRQLLVTSSTANLQQLPAVLQRMQCFDAVIVSEQHHRLVLSAGGHAVQEGPTHPANGSAAGGSVLDLVFLRPRELQVVLASNSKHTLDCLEGLVLGAMRMLPGGTADITVQATCPSPAKLGSLAAATQCLADATHLHVKVLEDTMQQLPAARSKPEGVKHIAAAAAGPAHARAATAAAGSNCAARSDGTSCAGLLLVDGVSVGCELAECWMSTLVSQADVDLSMARLCNV